MDRSIPSIFQGEHVPLVLAPQAGVSESPFRRLCRSFGADVVVSEFVSADGICHGNQRTLDYLRFDEAERPIGVQIFGADPERMASAARFVAETHGPDFVDVNFGCPVKKIVKRNGGSGCLRDLGLVRAILQAVDEATPLPTTAKVRSGYDESTRDPVAVGRACQEAGARVVTLHPRTREDMYSGSARWEEIRALARELSVPVVGNGDIRTAEDAVRMWEETGCDGIMLARGSHGSPWLFSQARAALDGRPVPGDPGVEELFRICLRHAEHAIAFKDDPEKATREFRKHLGWYTRGLPDGKALRSKLFRVTDVHEIRRLLEEYLAEHREGAAAVHPATSAPQEGRPGRAVTGNAA